MTEYPVTALCWFISLIVASFIASECEWMVRDSSATKEPGTNDSRRPHKHLPQQNEASGSCLFEIKMRSNEQALWSVKFFYSKLAFILYVFRLIHYISSGILDKWMRMVLNCPLCVMQQWSTTSGTLHTHTKRCNLTANFWADVLYFTIFALFGNCKLWIIFSLH